MASNFLAAMIGCKVVLKVDFRNALYFLAELATWGGASLGCVALATEQR